MSKPKVGIFGLTSCAGDQLVVVNCEDELVAIANAVDIKSFIMAQTFREEKEFDVSFVEGSVVTKEDEERLKEIREKSAILVAIGTCAAWGGIPGSVNDVDRKELYETVYGTESNLYEADVARPLKAVVKVDFVIPGCPIEKEQLLRGIASLLHGDLPLLPTYPVCLECKMKENVCLLNTQGRICCGPLTVGGCGARCPSHNIPCEGCRGPVDEANVASEADLLVEKGYNINDVRRVVRTFAFELDASEKAS